jgi:tetratricopeptide (TPR) repeat protein/O-antigen ligase
VEKPPRFLSLCIYALFLVCPLLFFTDLTRNPFYTQIALLNILICACWLTWIVQGLRRGEWLWISSPLDRVLWALIAVCLLSWGNSWLRHPNLRPSIYSEGSRAMIFLIVNVYLVFAAALRFQDRQRLKRLLWASYAVAFAASVYGVAQYYGMEWIWRQNLNPYGYRPVSTFGNPNFMSSYLVVILPVAFADYVFRFSGINRVPLFAVCLASVGALIATLTRSSWAGALLGVGIVLWALQQQTELWAKARKSLIVIGIAAALAVFAWPKNGGTSYSQTVFGRLGEITQASTGRYGAVTQRLLIWLSAWEIAQDHPVIGNGWGTFELFFPFYQGTQLDRPVFAPFRTHANNAHDEILEYLSQVGLAGLGIMILLWIVFFRSAAGIAARIAGPWSGLEWGLIGGVAGMLVDNLLNVSVHFAVPAFIFWWWVGSAFVLDPAATRISRHSLQPAWRKTALILSAAILVCFTVRSAQVWAEEVFFFEGFKLSKAGNLPGAQRSLEKAYGYFKLDVNNNYELANVYARSGQPAKALEFYGHALDANAGYDEIYFNRATMLAQVGNEKDAIWNYRQALLINPLSREAYNALANIYLKDIARHGDAGEALYRRALEVYPDEKDYWNNLGYLRVQRGQWEPAYEAYRKAVEIDPEFEIARRNLAVAASHLPAHAADPILQAESRLSNIERLISAKRWDEALGQAKRLVEILPNSLRARFYLGNIYIALQRPADALVHYQVVVQRQPNSVAGWSNLAVTEDMLHQTEAGAAAWQRVLALDPNNAQAKARLAAR